MIAAILTDPFWRWNYTRLERASLSESQSVKYQPEWRLPPGMSSNPDSPSLFTDNMVKQLSGHPWLLLGYSFLPGQFTPTSTGSAQS